MPQFESESLVLRSYDLAEADRIVVFLTREYGIVRGVAKGAKRLKSRFGSTLETFSSVDLAFFQKDDRELVSIQHVELKRSFFDSASDPEFLQTLAYIADLLIAFLPPHDPSEKTYRMTKACLDASNGDPARLAAARLYFELWMLRLGGYLPDWSSCRECGRSIEPARLASVRPDHHLRCEHCRPVPSTAAIGPEHRRLFTGIQKLSPPVFLDEVADDSQVVDELSAVLRRIIGQVLGKELLQPARVLSAPRS